MTSLLNAQRSAVASIVIGYAFLATTIFLYLDRSSTAKLGPSLAQGIVAGYGALWLHLLHFVMAFTLIHALFGALIWWLTSPATKRIARSGHEFGQLGLLVLLMAHLYCILESAHRFPRTIIGGTILDATTSTYVESFSIVIGAALVGLVLWGILERVRTLSKNFSFSRAGITGGAALAIFAATALLGVGQPAPKSRSANATQPHIIIVGIDGWRLDALPQNMASRDIMPNIAKFFDKSTWIERTVTPLARTYPAWWTILTGQYPPTHGVRFNLIPDEYIATPLRLAEQLGSLGYHSIFSLDERRFANIRTSQGFDEVIGPAMGAADFILGNLADAPLTNLVFNHQIARYLFPFNHANRAAYKTYMPETFDRLLRQAINDAPRKPLFIVTHYELPHWPFSWAYGPTGKRFIEDAEPERNAYFEALHRTDQQFGELLTHLKDIGVLNNAIMVVLSDHGEGLPDDNAVWHDSATGGRRPVPAGHGNSVIGLAQHLVPLGFRCFGACNLSSGRRAGTASLADVYPTLTDLLSIPARPHDGQSLVRVLLDPSRKITPKPIPLETGFNTDASASGIFDAGRLMDEGAAYYRVTQDGRVEIKPELVTGLIADKQRAVYFGESIIMPTTLQLGGGTELFIGNIRSHSYKTFPLDRANPEIQPALEAYLNYFSEETETGQ